MFFLGASREFYRGILLLHEVLNLWSSFKCCAGHNRRMSANCKAIFAERTPCRCFFSPPLESPAGLKQAATSRAAPPVPQKDGFMVAREFTFIRIRLVYYYDPCKNEGFQNMLMVRSFSFWRLAGVQDLISVGILAFWPPVLSRANGS